MALLGYGSFIVSLIFDLGLPWHIYMPIFNWQHHSVMFEIAWCVMLYFSVLGLEFSPVILEHRWFSGAIWRKILHLLHRATLPLVIAGIVLSTLHQSSLGSLFLIMPHRVHPLWYSPWIPVLFFISAIAAGLMALVVEGFLVERWFGKNVDLALLGRLERIAGFALGLYLALRLGDLWLRGVLPARLDGSWQSLLFGAEILLGGVLPLLLLSLPRARESREGLLTCALLVIFGIASQRMSLSMFTMWRPAGTTYAPTLPEIVIAFAIPAAAILLYLFFVENLAVLETETSQPQEVSAAPYPLGPGLKLPSHQSGLSHILARRSRLAVFVIALMLAIFPGQSAIGGNQAPSPVRPARGWGVLLIDGNSSAYVVAFPHVAHQERLIEQHGSEEAACQVCHHLNRPQDQATACWECHSDYVQPASIFNHARHQNALGGNASCTECHQGEHSKATAVPCAECHQAMAPVRGGAAFDYMAPSYLDALHGGCCECHQQQAQIDDRPELILCSTCHTYQEDPADIQALSMFRSGGAR
jgi:Ni/Fe-hydrogenase subunit HybB-like protein